MEQSNEMPKQKKASLICIDDSKLVRIRDIARTYGVGESTIYRWKAKGEFPKPYGRLSATIVVYLKDEIDNFFEDRIKQFAEQSEEVAV
jgi:predicted DNA-binding transcriptional regulator AlpA